MAEYIERERVVDVLVDMETLALYEDAIPAIKNIRRLIDGIPADDVAPVRHGRWIDTEPNKKDWDCRKNGMAYYCSCCMHRAGKEKHKTYKYCPWCGAKMDEEKE